MPVGPGARADPLGQEPEFHRAQDRRGAVLELELLEGVQEMRLDRRPAERASRTGFVPRAVQAIGMNRSGFEERLRRILRGEARARRRRRAGRGGGRARSTLRAWIVVAAGRSGFGDSSHFAPASDMGFPCNPSSAHQDPRKDGANPTEKGSRIP